MIIGTLFLIICGIRQYFSHLTKEHHVVLERVNSSRGMERNIFYFVSWLSSHSGQQGARALLFLFLMVLIGPTATTSWCDGYFLTGLGYEIPGLPPMRPTRVPATALLRIDYRLQEYMQSYKVGRKPTLEGFFSFIRRRSGMEVTHPAPGLPPLWSLKEESWDWIRSSEVLG
ncbi:Cytochrome c oxidase subunit 3 [Bienertia sinuspersici]